MLTEKDITIVQNKMATKSDFTEFKNDIRSILRNFKDEIITEIRKLRQEIKVKNL